MRRFGAWSIVAALACGGSTEGDTSDAESEAATSAATNGETETTATAGDGDGDGGDYPLDPDPTPAAMCADDQAANWTVTLPAQCVGRRTCVDEKVRFWVDEQPFFPRGLYNAGFEWTNLQTNCPAGAPCQVNVPTDADHFLDMLADQGFNLIFERSLSSPALITAVSNEPRIKLGHLLWHEVFADQQAHDDIVLEIEMAAANPEVIMWVGLDEYDLNNTEHYAAGLRRLLKGSSPELDTIMRDGGVFDPGPAAYFPATEPAHDPYDLPYSAALAFNSGLALGPLVYDMLWPVSYPFANATAPANTGSWGTARVSQYADEGLPMLPVHQAVSVGGIANFMPLPEQVAVQLFSSMAHGATGTWHFLAISGEPKLLGRDGWFIADAEHWPTYGEIHRLQDRMMPALYADTQQTLWWDPQSVELRLWASPERAMMLIVNPRSSSYDLDVRDIADIPDGWFVRDWDDCSPVTSATVTLPGYSWVLWEAYAP